MAPKQQAATADPWTMARGISGAPGADLELQVLQSVRTSCLNVGGAPAWRSLAALRELVVDLCISCGGIEDPHGLRANIDRALETRLRRRELQHAARAGMDDLRVSLEHAGLVPDPLVSV